MKYVRLFEDETFKAAVKDEVTLGSMKFYLYDDYINVYYTDSNFDPVTHSFGQSTPIFSLDKDSNFIDKVSSHTSKVPVEITVAFTLQKLGVEHEKKLLTHPVFSKWWAEMKKELIFNRFDL